MEDMNDEAIAAAVEPLRQPSGSGLMTPQPGQAAEMADLETSLPGVVPGEAGTGTSPAADNPAFMTPGQRADSLALMVEELQLMYLERTGG